MTDQSLPDKPKPRRHMTYDQRHQQLLDTALRMIRTEGTDALTLGRLAQAAHITKPTVYLHFGTRHGLLAALYHDFEVRQTAITDAAIAACAPNLRAKIRGIASGHINCVLTEGREMPEILAALRGSPELAQIRKQNQHDFMQKCQQVLAPFIAKPGLSASSLWAIQGAADSLAQAAVEQELTPEQASHTLGLLILTMVQSMDLNPESAAG